MLQAAAMRSRHAIGLAGRMARARARSRRAKQKEALVEPGAATKIDEVVVPPYDAAYWDGLEKNLKLVHEKSEAFGGVRSDTRRTEMTRLARMRDLRAHGVPEASPVYLTPLDLNHKDLVKWERDREPEVMKPTSRRSGVLGRKIGMTQVFDEWGTRIPLTMVSVDDCRVVQCKSTADGHLVNAVQVGVGTKKISKVPRPLLGHFMRAGVEPKQKLTEFRVTRDALLPEGLPLTARHFVPGQYVDVQGISQGKGYQGVMKRHGFAGQNATHGNSKTHRHRGSSGALGPSRVFKGLKMAGQMGAKKRTTQNVWVYMVDVKRNLLFLRGQVPGSKGGILRIADALRKPVHTHVPDGATVPFPAVMPSQLKEETLTDYLVAPRDHHIPEHLIVKGGGAAVRAKKGGGKG